MEAAACILEPLRVEKSYFNSAAGGFVEAAPLDSLGETDSRSAAVERVTWISSTAIAKL